MGLRLFRLLVGWWPQIEDEESTLTPSSTAQRVLSASPDERAELTKVVDLLAHFEGRGQRATRLVGPDGQSIVLPASAFEALRAVVSGLAQGMAMTLVPSGHELTTQQAAEILMISRPSVIRLLDDGA